MREVVREMILFILLSFFHVQGALAGPHTLIYYYTLNHRSTHLEEYSFVGVLDGCEIQYYDNNMDIAVPRQKWMAAAFDRKYWVTDTFTETGFHGIIKGQVDEWMRRHNETAKYHYTQGQFGCQVNDHSPNVGILKLAFDGRYAFSFDKDKLKWTVHDPIAEPFKEKWDKNEKMNRYFKSLLEHDCVDYWRTYYAIGKTYLTRKVSPEVTLAARTDDHSTLYCTVFAFYPPAINVSWLQNGHHVFETKSSGVIPNNDGTYHLKSVLVYDPYDGKQYSCHVDHSSLPGGKTIIWEGNGKKDRHIGLIAVCVLISLAIGLAVIVWWRKNRRAGEFDVHTHAKNSLLMQIMGQPVIIQIENIYYPILAIIGVPGHSRHIILQIVLYTCESLSSTGLGIEKYI
ncbi:class I histocompatibility antigen, F10 alpha chain-like isoform X5 [Leucoraja erinacea]|uniref:class I histocompatibility antigen, F10 alpha chain-like isoform X5 n=1 Tax=Leucoraja erinaceus TaxID=7782 RepID=UPI00245495CD|nr:class I histocompatibility antigen, F10 alpha chain-like isoform X5 [Leucoraja erinacea]